VWHLTQYAGDDSQQRPIVKTPLGVRLCRPSERVLEILPNPQQGPFTKEDGEVVIGKDGQRA
jgi:arsenate reductase